MKLKKKVVIPWCKMTLDNRNILKNGEKCKKPAAVPAVNFSHLPPSSSISASPAFTAYNKSIDQLID